MDLSNYKLPTVGKPAIRSERDSYLGLFTGRGIQLRDRKTKELRDATPAEIAKLLCFTPTEDLFAFHRMCEHANSYPRFFWWRLKGKQTKV